MEKFPRLLHSRFHFLKGMAAFLGRTTRSLAHRVNAAATLRHVPVAATFRRATGATGLNSPSGSNYYSVTAVRQEFKPVQITDELKSVIDPHGDSSEMMRYEVMKKLWVYIKANNLQSPEDGRQIQNDETFRRIFGCTEMSMFEMSRLLNKHIVK